MELLLQNGATNTNVYADGLRACLIAALKMPESIESTIKVRKGACNCAYLRFLGPRRELW